MTTEQMPFAVNPGGTVGLPADIQFFILYLGPTLPPAEVFANVQPQTQIDVFFRADDGTFPFWSTAPIPATLTMMETGKVYSVRVGVDATWVVPGTAQAPPSDGGGGFFTGNTALVLGAVALGGLFLFGRKR